MAPDGRPGSNDDRDDLNEAWARVDRDRLSDEIMAHVNPFVAEAAWWLSLMQTAGELGVLVMRHDDGPLAGMLAVKGPEATAVPIAAVDRLRECGIKPGAVAALLVAAAHDPQLTWWVDHDKVV